MATSTLAQPPWDLLVELGRPSIEYYTGDTNPTFNKPANEAFQERIRTWQLKGIETLVTLEAVRDMLRAFVQTHIPSSEIEED